MRKKGRKNYAVYDRNGQVVWEDKRSDKLAKLIAVLMQSAAIAFQAVKNWWDKLAVPEKNTETKAEKEARVFKETRNQIVTVFIIIAIAIGYCVRGKMPFLLATTGFVEALIVCGDAVIKREAIREGKSLKKTEKQLAKDLPKVFRGYCGLVILLSILAWAIDTGMLSSVGETFPMMKEFASWQVEKVNELLEFLNNFFHGQL